MLRGNMRIATKGDVLSVDIFSEEKVHRKSKTVSLIQMAKICTVKKSRRFYGKYWHLAVSTCTLIFTGVSRLFTNNYACLGSVGQGS